jgi:tRNA(fMet)-specific endonuclease VapC
MKSSGADSIERLVLDTSAYARLSAGDPAVMDMVATAGTVFVPVIVVGELEAGFAGGSRPAANRVALNDFLSEPFVTTLDVTRTVARRYGDVFAELRGAGTPIPTNDLWIAAATLDCGGSLLSFDAHFERVQGLRRVRPVAGQPD